MQASVAPSVAADRGAFRQRLPSPERFTAAVVWLSYCSLLSMGVLVLGW